MVIIIYVLNNSGVNNIIGLGQGGSFLQQLREQFMQVLGFLDYLSDRVADLSEDARNVLTFHDPVPVQVHQRQGHVHETVGQAVLFAPRPGNEQVPDQQTLVDAELGQEPRQEPLHRDHLNKLLAFVLLQLLEQPQVKFLHYGEEFLHVLLPALEMLARQARHDQLECEVRIALAHSPEILTVLVGVGVVDEGSELVHALGIVLCGVGLQVQEDDAGQAVRVVGLVGLAEGQLRGFQQQFRILEAELIGLLEELAVFPCAFRVFFDEVPQLDIFEVVTPFRLLRKTQGMILDCLLLRAFTFLHLPMAASATHFRHRHGQSQLLLNRPHNVEPHRLAIDHQVFLHLRHPLLLASHFQVPYAYLPEQRPDRVVLIGQLLRGVLGLSALVEHLQAADEAFPGIGQVDRLLAEDLVYLVQSQVLELVQMLGDFDEGVHVYEMVNDLGLGFGPGLLFFGHRGHLYARVLRLLLPRERHETFDPFFHRSIKIIIARHALEQIGLNLDEIRNLIQMLPYAHRYGVLELLNALFLVYTFMPSPALSQFSTEYPLLASALLPTTVPLATLLWSRCMQNEECRILSLVCGVGFSTRRQCAGLVSRVWKRAGRYTGGCECRLFRGTVTQSRDRTSRDFWPRLGSRVRCLGLEMRNSRRCLGRVEVEALWSQRQGSTSLLYFFFRLADTLDCSCTMISTLFSKIPFLNPSPGTNSSPWPSCIPSFHCPLQKLPSTQYIYPYPFRKFQEQLPLQTFPVDQVNMPQPDFLSSLYPPSYISVLPCPFFHMPWPSRRPSLKLPLKQLPLDQQYQPQPLGLPLLYMPLQRSPLANFSIPCPSLRHYLNQPQYLSPLTQVCTPQPSVLPNFHSPMYESPLTPRHMPDPCFMPLTHSPQQNYPFGQMYLPMPSGLPLTYWP